MSRHAAIASLPLCLVAGCASLFGGGAGVPSAYQGTTRIVVANASDAELCAFAVFSGNDSAHNWLGQNGEKSIAPGAQREFQIKPGTYHVMGGYFLARARGGSCQSGEILAAGGTYGEATVEIKGASLVTMGPKPTAPVDGLEVVAFPKFFGETGGARQPESAQENCQPTGFPAISGPESCCSKAASMKDTPISETVNGKSVPRQELKCD